MPGTRAEAVLTELRRRILSGDIPPKTKLRQVDISQQFGVSTTPVREAFLALAREGLVNQDAHRGVEVALPSQADLRENYEIRIALEPLATELAADRLTEGQLDMIRQIQDRMSRAEETSERAALNRAFHSEIYAAARRPRLQRVISEFRNSADVFLNLLSTHPSAEFRAAVASEHDEILEGLRAADGKRAAEAMRAHLTHSLWQISQLLDAMEREAPERAADVSSRSIS
jgi:DNA-binding GntR family transcriptional regulator